MTPAYVLELGTGGTPTNLATWITDNPGIFYAYLTPEAWDSIGTLSPPSTPTLGSASGGTLPATTYYAKVTYTNSYGETTPSPAASEAVSENNVLVVDSPATESGATGWDVYVGTSASTVQKQNASPLTIGTNWTMPDSGPITGASPPTLNTTNGFIDFLEQFEGLTAQTYFFVTTTVSTYTQYTAQMKDVFALVESPNAPDTEFSCAAPLWKWLSYSPSAVNRMTPMAFSYLFDVSPYPLPGNGTILSQFKTAAINYVGTGAEGGISTAVLFWGTTKDGNDASYWYDVDWAVINSHQALAAAVINGSNNPQNPLYYNQGGINQLAAVEQGVANSMLAFGIALQVTVTATPFNTYVQENPDDYAAGIYNGLALALVPQLGFKQITFNVNVSDIPTAT